MLARSSLPLFCIGRPSSKRAESLRAPGLRCAYRIVISIVACPRSSWIAFSGAPRIASTSDGRQLATLSAGGTPVNSESSYAPFREDAATPAPRDDTPRPEPTTEQLVKRMTTAIERCHGAMTPQFCRQFAKLPEKTRLRFLKSVELLTAKSAALSE